MLRDVYLHTEEAAGDDKFQYQEYLLDSRLSPAHKPSCDSGFFFTGKTNLKVKPFSLELQDDK